jgi:large subunit ribosomal protein L22
MEPTTPTGHSATSVKLTRKQKIAQGLPKPFPGSNRKQVRAQERKEAMKTTYVASLNDFPSSPRKMRMVTTLIRGMEAQRALHILALTNRASARPLRKLLLSAIESYQQKSGTSADQAPLFIKKIDVDGGPMLKRLRPAPQGRGHRIRKRSNHVTLFLDVREEQAN